MGVSINRVVISGHLCFDPELKVVTGDRMVTNLRVAVNDREQDATGEWVDRASFVDVTVWGAQAESCAAHLAKGSAVAVDGRLRQDNWQAQDGTPRQTLKIVAERVQFIGPRADSAPAGRQATAPAADAAPETEAVVSAGDFDDADIPF